MSDSSPATPRAGWVDTFRGLAIILMVLGHVLGGLGYEVNIPGREAVWPLYRWIYTFHMPAFFLASGLFVGQSVRSRGLWAFVRLKFDTLMYPYLLWGVLGWLVHECVRGYTHSQPRAPVALLWDPNSGLWFLYVLFLLSILSGGLQAARVPTLGRFAVSVAGWVAYTVAGESFPPIVSLPLKFGPYFAAGELLHPVVHRMNASALVSATAAVGGGALSLASTSAGWPSQIWVSPVVTLFGIVFLFGVSGLADRVSWLGWLRLCGRSSLQIYVLHAYPSVLSRILLLKLFGIADLGVHALVGTVAGVAVPLLTVLPPVAVRVSWLFRRPRFSRRGSLPPSHPVSQPDRPSVGSLSSGE